MILTSSEMRALEEKAFASGITAEDLMAEAGEKIAEAVRQFRPKPGRCIVVFGKGHNGGDALVAARHLARAGWVIELIPAFDREEWAPLTTRQYERLHSVVAGTPSLPSPAPLIVLDGLLGIGAGGRLREPILQAAHQINLLRQEENALVFALDLPTGLDGDTGEVDPDTVVADVTLAISCAKTGLLADHALSNVGRLAVLPLTELTRRMEGNNGGSLVATAAQLRSLVPPRPFGLHKGAAGRVSIIAGSVGAVGAAVMCAEGALHGGAGLITLHVTPDIYDIVAMRVAPEVMVRPVKGSIMDALADQPHDVIAMGPGLGPDPKEETRHLLANSNRPIVLDADGLNALAKDLSVLDRCVAPLLLTPHPGEMARLDPESKNRSRSATVELFKSRWPHTLLFKGSRSIIGQRGRPLSYNSTGHPGLATGGVGDIMTGLLAALAAQGLPFYDAARVGSWIIGRAAERAVHLHDDSGESLSATRLLNHFGGAFEDLRSAVF